MCVVCQVSGMSGKTCLTGVRCVTIVSTVSCHLSCYRYKGVREAGMSVLDVGLFTGYQPITEDLEKVSHLCNLEVA